MIEARQIFRFSFAAIGLLFGFSSSLFSQTHDSDKETGMLFIRHYSPKEYKNFPQNWAGIQDSRGVMIFANGDGVLKFDGVAWEFHSLPKLPVVRSLAMDENGRIYVGAYDEFGYLDADTLGNYLYTSLVSHLTETQKEFGSVIKICCSKDSVIFQTEKGLLIQRNNQFRQIEWPGEKNYRKVFLEDSILYVPRDTVGLCMLKGDELVKAKGGEFFKGKTIRVILPFNENFKLILTSQHGLFLYNENETVPLKTEIDDFLNKSMIYCGIRLLNGDYAIGTLMGGAFIIDKNGKLKSILNKSTGLGDVSVYNFCLDDQGALWAMLSHGISRVETHIAISHFLEDSGPEGSVNAIDRFQGVLYVGTSQGLYRLKPAKLPETPAYFERVDELNTGVWGIANLGSALIINTLEGAFILENDKFRQINNYPSYSIFPWRLDPDIIFSGLRDGLSILKKVNGQWIDGGRISGIRAETAEIEEASNGGLWVSSYSEGVFLLTFSSKNGKTDYLNPLVRNFGENDGLKSGHAKILRIDGRELFFVKRNEELDQLYLFDRDKEKFIEYNDFAADLGLAAISGHPIAGKKNEKFWIQDNNNNDRIIVTKKSDKTFDFQKISFSRLAAFPFRIVYDENEIAWWGGHEGIVRVETSKVKGKSQKSFDPYQ